MYYLGVGEFRKYLTSNEPQSGGFPVGPQKFENLKSCENGEQKTLRKRNFRNPQKLSFFAIVAKRFQLKVHRFVRAKRHKSVCTI